MSKTDRLFGALGTKAPPKAAIIKALYQVEGASAAERPEALENLVGQIHDLYATNQTAAISVAFEAANSMLSDVREMGLNTVSDLALRKDNRAPMLDGLVHMAIVQGDMETRDSPLVGKLGRAIDTIAQRDLKGADYSTAKAVAEAAGRLDRSSYFAALGGEIVARTGIPAANGRGPSPIDNPAYA